MFKLKAINSREWENPEKLQHFGLTYWGSDKSLHLDFGFYSLKLEWGFKHV